MGASVSRNKDIDGEFVSNWIKDARKQLNDPCNPIIRCNQFLQNYAKPLVNNAYNLSSKPNGLDFKIEFEHETADSEELSISSSIAMEEAIDALVFGLESQLNDGHTYITGLGTATVAVGTEVSTEDATIVTQKTAIGIITTFLLGSRLVNKNYENAWQPQVQIGNIVNSYFQDQSLLSLGINTISDQSITNGVNNVEAFAKGMKNVKYPSQLTTADECNLVFDSKDFVLMEGSLLRLDLDKCDNAINSGYKFYKARGCGNIRGGLFKVDGRHKGSSCEGNVAVVRAEESQLYNMLSYFFRNLKHH